jgi:phosphohistidine phosphatase
MRVFLVQHGEAKTEREDPDRPLSERGAREVSRVARAAREARVVTASRILHSGKTRARQTAETWYEALDVPITEVAGLAPGDDPAIWANRITRETGDVMLVGHLPHLARLAGLLLAGDPDRAVIAFRPGGLVGLDQVEGGWSVFLVMPPPQ